MLTAFPKRLDLWDEYSEVRRESLRTGKEREGVERMIPDPPPDTVLRDDQLRLIFTCASRASAG